MPRELYEGHKKRVITFRVSDKTHQNFIKFLDEAEKEIGFRPVKADILRRILKEYLTLWFKEINKKEGLEE